MCYIYIILYEQVNYQIIISILRLTRYNVFLQCIHNYIITYFINYYQRSEGIISFFFKCVKRNILSIENSIDVYISYPYF